jgi:hypothetical protein
MAGGGQTIARVYGGVLGSPWPTSRVGGMVSEKQVVIAVEWLFTQFKKCEVLPMAEAMGAHGNVRIKRGLSRSNTMEME